jgi:hypothetical protein
MQKPLNLNLLGIWNDKEIMVLNRNGSWISFVYYGGGRNKNIPTGRLTVFFFFQQLPSAYLVPSSGNC